MSNIYEDLVRTMNIDTETPYLAELSGTGENGAHLRNEGAVVFSLDAGCLEYTFALTRDDVWLLHNHKLVSAPDLRLAVPSIGFDRSVLTTNFSSNPTKGVIPLECFGDPTADLGYVGIKFRNLPDGWYNADSGCEVRASLDRPPVPDENGNISLGRGYGWGLIPAIKLEWIKGQGETWTIRLRRIPDDQRDSDHNFRCTISVDGAKLTGEIAEEFLRENLRPFLQFAFAGRADNYVAVGYNTDHAPTWGMQIRDTGVDIPEQYRSHNWFLALRNGRISLSPQFQAFCDLDAETKRRYHRVIEAYARSEQVYALVGDSTTAAALSFAALDSLVRIIAIDYRDSDDWLEKNLQVVRGKHIEDVIDLVAERELNGPAEVSAFKRAAKAVAKTRNNAFHADPARERPDWNESRQQWDNTQTMVEILLLSRLGMESIPLRTSVPTFLVDGRDMLAEARKSSIAEWMVNRVEADGTNELA